MTAKINKLLQIYLRPEIIKIIIHFSSKRNGSRLSDTMTVRINVYLAHKSENFKNNFNCLTILSCIPILTVRNLSIYSTTSLQINEMNAETNQDAEFSITLFDTFTGTFHEFFLCGFAKCSSVHHVLSLVFQFGPVILSIV